MFLNKLQEVLSSLYSILVEPVVDARKNEPKLEFLGILFSKAPFLFNLLSSYLENI